MKSPSVLDAPVPSRSPWQRFYTAAHLLREKHWRTRARRLPRPVLSVGNLHFGGTGKTPVVAALARHLQDQNRRVAILSRGWGRRGERETRIVSRGRGPEISPALAGDEPWLLSDLLPGVSVVVARRRYDAGLLALDELDPPPDVFLLDDGFTHLPLARDLDLLVLPESDPWGGGRLLPSGRLREPLAASHRAHAILLSGADVSDSKARAVALSLEAWDFSGPGFATPTVSEAPRNSSGSSLPPGARVLLVSGIARPRRFERSAVAIGLEVADHLVFPDHFTYPDRSLEAIRRRARQLGPLPVLTTAKDRMKIADRLQPEPFVLPIHARPTEEFFGWMNRQLEPLFDDP